MTIDKAFNYTLINLDTPGINIHKASVEKSTKLLAWGYLSY